MPETGKIIALVAIYYQIDTPKLFSRTRGRKEIAKARQMAMYLVRQRLGWSYPRIGRVFKRDHTVVIHACRVAERWQSEAAEIAARLV